MQTNDQPKKLGHLHSKTASKTILLIGSGRLAKHLHHWNSLLENPNHLLTWDRSQDPHALLSHLNKASLVWLAISDSAILTFFEKHLAAADVPTVHFSGALSDPRLMSAHPLMSFPLELMPDEAYSKIHFGVTGVSSLAEVLPGFANSYFQVREENKALYHALCVISGNFPQLLWNEISGEFKKLEIPEESLKVYLEQVLANFLTLKEKALTGPLIRKDEITLNKNESALAGTKLQPIYHAFRKEFSR